MLGIMENLWAIPMIFRQAEVQARKVSKRSYLEEMGAGRNNHYNISKLLFISNND